MRTETMATVFVGVLLIGAGAGYWYLTTSEEKPSSISLKEMSKSDRENKVL